MVDLWKFEQWNEDICRIGNGAECTKFILKVFLLYFLVAVGQLTMPDIWTALKSVFVEELQDVDSLQAIEWI